MRGRSVVRLLTAGPLLGASAVAVTSAVVGRLLRSLAAARPPARAEAPPPPSVAGVDVRVTWTTVEVRWTAR
ncbi:hypothetical protein ACI782_11605 [Geodermatophilus sp. SYSU D00703]